MGFSLDVLIAMGLRLSFMWTVFFFYFAYAMHIDHQLIYSQWMNIEHFEESVCVCEKQRIFENRPNFPAS